MHKWWEKGEYTKKKLKTKMKCQAEIEAKEMKEKISNDSVLQETQFFKQF